MPIGKLAGLRRTGNFPHGFFRMRECLLLICFLSLAAVSGFAATPKTCPGSTGIGSFGLFVTPPKSGPPLPIESVNEIGPGDRLEYEPAHFSGKDKRKARITVILGSGDVASSGRVTVLKVRRANRPARWKIPFRTSIVGLVFGPKGLSVKKVNSFVRKNPDLIPQMANYAQQASTVEALVQTLTQYEQSKPGATTLQSALDGFSQQYGISLPSLNSGESTTQQANALLHAMLPAVSSKEHLTSGKTLLKGSTGLAASVASMFFGSPVGLATGGAVLFETLKTSLFPRTDFQPAFVHVSDPHRMTLCSNAAHAKSGTRIAYLWVRRIPDADAPPVSLLHSERLPLGWNSTVKVTTASVAQLKLVSRIRAWRIVSAKDSTPVPVKVADGSAADLLTLELRHAKLAPGVYHLAAKWDWTPLPVSGTISLVRFPDLSSAAIATESQDRLIEGNGIQWVRLTGADFEFVDHVALISPAQPGVAPAPLSFTLPQDRQPGELTSMDVKVDCAALTPGPYRLRLSQRNGSTRSLPLTIHPPDPTLAHLPLRLNLGSHSQTILLRGTRLDRIERITSPGAVWKLAPVRSGSPGLTRRRVTIALASTVRQGQRLPATVFVAGLHQPMEVPGAIEVIGPLPRIVSVRKSIAKQGGVQLLQGEIPAETAVSFLIHTEHAGSHPVVDLSCREGADDSFKLALASGARRGSAEFDATGGNSFFLSLDPGSANPSGCRLTASIVNRATGASASYPLGRVVLLPTIEKFSLSKKLHGPGLYVGTLTGRNLQVIGKTGWNLTRGFQVLGIPTPVQGNPREQTLQIVMPWPPPSPQAPLYVWLHGETRGRRTSATY